jgi:hypothetical protein
LGERSGFAVIGPEFGLRGKVVEFGDSALFDRQVKATPGGSRVFLSWSKDARGFHGEPGLHG